MPLKITQTLFYLLHKYLQKASEIKKQLTGFKEFYYSSKKFNTE